MKNKFDIKFYFFVTILASAISTLSMNLFNLSYITFIILDVALILLGVFLKKIFKH